MKFQAVNESFFYLADFPIKKENEMYLKSVPILIYVKRKYV